MRNQMEEICANCDFANSATYKTMPTMVNKVLDNTISDSIESGVLKQDTTTATGTEEDGCENNDQSGRHYVVITTTTGTPLGSCLEGLFKVIYEFLRAINRQPGLKTQKQSDYSISNHHSAYRENYLLCDGM